MIVGQVDIEAMRRVIDALPLGIKRADTETPDGRKIVGYYVTDKQIRIDIVEAKQ
jgi:hypothetical protein